MDWVTLGGNRYSQMLSASAGGSIDLKRLAILKGGYKKLRALWGFRLSLLILLLPDECGMI